MSEAKDCSGCNVRLPVAVFGITSRGRTHSRCRKCRIAYGAEYRAANRGKIRQWVVDNVERVQQYRRERYRKEKDADPVAFNARRRDIWSKQYEREPEKFIAKAHRALARRAGAPGRGVTAAEWKDTLDAALGLCAYCAKPKRLTMDHIEPMSRGGAHEPENIVAACNECNASKCDRPLVLWLAQRASP